MYWLKWVHFHFEAVPRTKFLHLGTPEWGQQDQWELETWAAVTRVVQRCLKGFLREMKLVRLVSNLTLTWMPFVALHMPQYHCILEALSWRARDRWACYQTAGIIASRSGSQSLLHILPSCNICAMHLWRSHVISPWSPVDVNETAETAQTTLQTLRDGG